MKINEIKKKLEKMNTQKIKWERDIENILRKWGEKGIESKEEAQLEKERLSAELEKLKRREEKLLKKLHDDYDWDSLE